MTPGVLVRLRQRAGWYVRSWLQLLRSDRKFRCGFDPCLFRLGFFSHRARLFPFHHYDPRWFITDWAIQTRFPKINPPAVVAALSNKHDCHLLLRELGFGGRTAPLIGTVCNGVFHSLSQYGTLGAAFKDYTRLAAKPLCGWGGAGVMLLENAGAMPVSGTYLIEGGVTQHAYSAGIFPHSINTIRVMTLRNDDEPPFILGAAHRFGVASSAPVDNISRGGLGTHVDLESGRLSSAYCTVGLRREHRFTHHPDTGVSFSAVTVPMWSEVKALSLELAARVPGLNLAGWDICVTPDGPRLIEGNARAPDPELVQAHRPVLLDERARRFFARHRVISWARYDELEELAKNFRSSSPDVPQQRPMLKVGLGV